MGVDDLVTSSDQLRRALSRARAANLVEEELPVLTALAELHRSRSEYDTARDLLEQI